MHGKDHRAEHENIGVLRAAAIWRAAPCREKRAKVGGEVVLEGGSPDSRGTVPLYAAGWRVAERDA